MGGLNGGYCHLRIACRGRQIIMAEQGLDDADIGTLFQKMGGETVAQGVGRDPFIQPRRRPS